MSKTQQNTIEIFTIKDVSETTGVHPQTLRNWEKEGLITPQRVSGNQRIFKAQDVERVKEILSLKEQGYQIKGIRGVLLGNKTNGRKKKEVVQEPSISKETTSTNVVSMTSKRGKAGRPAKKMNMIAAAPLEVLERPTKKPGRPPKVRKYNIPELEEMSTKDLAKIAHDLNVKYFRQMLKEELIMAIAVPEKRDEIIEVVKERTKERYGSKAEEVLNNESGETQNGTEISNEVQDGLVEGPSSEEAGNGLIEGEVKSDSNKGTDDSSKESDNKGVVEKVESSAKENSTNSNDNYIEKILAWGKEGKSPEEIQELLSV